MQKEHNRSVYWMTAVLCGFAMIAALFFSGTLVVNYTAVITEDLGISRTAFSVYSAIRSLVTFAANLMMVKLVRRFSLKTLILTGLVSSALNLLILSLCRSFPTVCLLALLGGGASALCGAVPLTMVIRNWFRKSYGTILALVMSASGIGGVVISPAVSLLTESAGWRVSFRVLAAFSLLVCALCLFLLHTDPGELGLPAYGAAPDDLPAQAEAAEPASGQSVSLLGRDQASRDTRTLLFITGCFSLGALGIFTNVASVIQDAGLPSLFATGIALSCASFSNSLGKIGMGWINDRFGTGVMLMLWYGICPLSMAYFLLFPAPSEALAIPGALLIGFTAGIYTVPVPLACSKLFRDRELCLSAMSICSAGINLFYALTGFICHGFYDYTGSYAGALLFSTVLGVLAFAVLMVLLRRERQVFFPERRQAARPAFDGGHGA